ncbi:hypothetical protein ACLKA7_016471 [Drosophila subpalustris]
MNAVQLQQRSCINVTRDASDAIDATGGRDRADKTEASPSRSQSSVHHVNADAAATVAAALQQRQLS